MFNLIFFYYKSSKPKNTTKQTFLSNGKTKTRTLNICHSVTDISKRRGVKRSELAVWSFIPQLYETFKQRNILDTTDFFQNGSGNKNRLFLAIKSISVINRPSLTQSDLAQIEPTRPGPVRPDHDTFFYSLLLNLSRR